MMAPGSFMPFLKSPLFSWRGKLRMAMEFFIPRRGRDTDEAVAHFVRRRLGTEAFTRIAQPMIGGIYTSDAENLSLKATFPRFLEMETRTGALSRHFALKRKKRPKPVRTRVDLVIAFFCHSNPECRPWSTHSLKLCLAVLG